MYIDFIKMREQMVEGQLRPQGIVNPGVLNAMRTIPREDFVDKSLRKECYQETLYYTDATLQRFMLPPTVFGKMLQALDIKPSDIVLDIGCGRGYHSAIMGTLADTVLAIDNKQFFIDKTAENCIRNDITNIVPQLVTDYWTQTADKAPFDVIFIGGGICNKIPESLLRQLSEHGRLAAIVISDASPHGSAVLVTRQGSSYLYDSIVECSAPLIDKPRSPAFTF